jgi:hypothetical protein
VRTDPHSPLPHDEARMERLLALYDRYCRQPGADDAGANARRKDVAAVPCKLAPTVLRRVASHPVQ